MNMLMRGASRPFAITSCCVEKEAQNEESTWNMHVFCKQVHESTKTCMFLCKYMKAQKHTVSKYMKAQKHACFHVVSPISTHFPPK